MTIARIVRFLVGVGIRRDHLNRCAQARGFLDVAGTYNGLDVYLIEVMTKALVPGGEEHSASNAASSA